MNTTTTNNNHSTHQPSGAHLRLRQAIPNFFTVGSMVCGLSALFLINAHYLHAAAFMVCIAMLLDSLDGRVARLIHGMSPFGAQMDSLADVISFGVVPAFALAPTLFSFSHCSDISFLVSCLYLTAVAIRLARFNCRIGVASADYFEGLPCPAAAGLVMLLITLLTDHQFTRFLTTPITTSLSVVPTAVASTLAWKKLLLTGTALLTSILMVSKIPFYNFKHLHWNWRKLLLCCGALLCLVLLFMHCAPNTALFVKMALALVVILSLYIMGALLWWPVRCYIVNNYVAKNANTNKHEPQQH